MAGGATSLATYAQRSVTLLLVGATCYYGALLFNDTYRLRKRNREKSEQEKKDTVNLIL